MTEPLNIKSVYTADIAKPKEETEMFYETLQTEINRLPKGRKLIILEDLNAIIGNTPIPCVMNRFNANHINSKGEALAECCSMNELTINNTFFDRKPRHKITWSNTRRQQFTID